MMLIRKWSIPFVVLLLALSCGSDSNKKEQEITGIEDPSGSDEKVNYSLDWIEGSWIDTTVFNGRVSFFETWSKEEEEVFSGEKFQIVKGDSSSPTRLTLVKTDGIYYYSYFDEEEQTTFIQDSIGTQFISFQNTKDQFPQNLSYSLRTDSLIISFSGMANGVYRSSSFKTKKLTK